MLYIDSYHEAFDASRFILLLLVYPKEQNMQLTELSPLKRQNIKK